MHIAQFHGAPAYAIGLAVTLVLASWLTPRHWWRRPTARGLLILGGGAWAGGSLLLLLAQAPLRPFSQAWNGSGLPAPLALDGAGAHIDGVGAGSDAGGGAGIGAADFAGAPASGLASRPARPPSSRSLTAATVTPPAPPPEAIPKAGRSFYAHRDLNLRAAAGVGAARLAVVPAGAAVTPTGARDGDWWQVRARADGKVSTGWVSSLWLRRANE
ncbi:MAG: SH3 domain-containing protein [Pseudomonadota bacterium]